jgi:hypothetical protein
MNTENNVKFIVVGKENNPMEVISLYEVKLSMRPGDKVFRSIGGQKYEVVEKIYKLSASDMLSLDQVVLKEITP